MGYLELIRRAAELPARVVWSLVFERPEDFDYESTTTRMPDWRTAGRVWVVPFGPNVPDEETANIVLRMPVSLIRDASDPEQARGAVLMGADEAFQRFRRTLRSR